MNVKSGYWFILINLYNYIWDFSTDIYGLFTIGLWIDYRSYNSDSEDEDEGEGSESDDDDSDGPVRQSGVVRLIRRRSRQLARDNWTKKNIFNSNAISITVITIEI